MLVLGSANRDWPDRDGSVVQCMRNKNPAPSRGRAFSRRALQDQCNGRIGYLRPRATGEVALVGCRPLGARFQKSGTDCAGVNGSNVVVHALGLVTFFRAMAMRSRTKPA